MRLEYDDELCAQMGLNGHSQMRVPCKYKNLWWTLSTHDEDDEYVAFGYGDLDQSDINRIHDYLCHPSNDGLVFTGWNEAHDSRYQLIDYPIIKISQRDGITQPYRDAMKKRMGVVA